MKVTSLLTDTRGMSRRRTVVLVLLALVAAAGAGALLGLYMTPGLSLTGGVKQVFVPPFRGKSLVRILVLGEDNTGGKKEKPLGLSDTIMLVSIDRDNNQISALSIPRDTRIDMAACGGPCKINASHTIGGPYLVGAAVEQLTGIRADYYIKTNSEGLKNCVDILGGVEIDVEKKMDYDDNWGNLHIHLKKGRQILNGEQAVGYVRFRHDAMGDITRIERQQKFMKIMAKKALEPGNLVKLPKLVREMSKNIETDMTVKDLIYLARLPEKVNMDEVKTGTLPGVPQTIGGGSYWIADTEKTFEMVQELFFTRTIAGLPKVQVLNGSGIAGAAQEVAKALRQQGYQVTEVGNAESFNYPSSEVIGHKPEVAGLEQIATTVNSSTVRYETQAEAKADVTVIVGKDCLLIPAAGG